MRNKGRIVIIMLIALVLVQYQNCDPFSGEFKSITVLNSEFLNRNSGGGNAIGYDGKKNLLLIRSQPYPLNFTPTNEDYYRLKPNFACSTNGSDEVLSHRGLIDFINESASLTMNSCATESSLITDYEIRSYNTDFLTYLNGIYEQMDAPLFDTSGIVALCQTQELKEVGSQVVIKRTRLGPESVDGAQLSLDFTDHLIPSNFTFDRQDSGQPVATYYDQNGILQTAGAGEARFGYEPISKEFRGLLIEGTRTNYFIQSEDMESTSAIVGLNVVANNVSAPDQNNTAESFSETIEEEARDISWDFQLVQDESTYSFSIFIKPNERFNYRIQVVGSSSNETIYEDFNLIGKGEATGEAQEFDSLKKVASDVRPLPDGWYRVWISFSSTMETQLKISIQPLANQENVYQGDPTKGFALWGGQIEVDEYPSSYISTLDQAITRNRDQLESIDVSWFVPGAPGAFFLHWDLQWVVESASIRMGLNLIQLEGSPSETINTIRIFGRSWRGSPYQPSYQIIANSNSVFSVSGLDWANQGERRNVFTYSADEGTGYENGYAAGVRNVGTLPTEFSRLIIGGTHWDGHYAFGYIKKVYYWPMQLSDAQMVSISTTTDETLHASLVKGEVNDDGEGIRTEVQNFPVLSKSVDGKRVFGSRVFNFQIEMEDEPESTSIGYLNALIDNEDVSLVMECRYTDN